MTLRKKEKTKNTPCSFGSSPPNLLNRHFIGSHSQDQNIHQMFKGAHGHSLHPCSLSPNGQCFPNLQPSSLPGSFQGPHRVPPLSHPGQLQTRGNFFVCAAHSLCFPFRTQHRFSQHRLANGAKLGIRSGCRDEKQELSFHSRPHISTHPLPALSIRNPNSSRAKQPQSGDSFTFHSPKGQHAPNPTSRWP